MFQHCLIKFQVPPSHFHPVKLTKDLTYIFVGMTVLITPVIFKNALFTRVQHVNTSSLGLTSIHWERINLHLKAPETELSQARRRNGAQVESASPRFFLLFSISGSLCMPRDLYVEPQPFAV